MTNDESDHSFQDLLNGVDDIEVLRLVVEILANEVADLRNWSNPNGALFIAKLNIKSAERKLAT